MIFNKNQLKKLHRPQNNSKENMGLVTIIGGSSLFHGAPILALKTASRVVDTVFFATPEKSVGYIAEQIKSKLMSFVWIPWDERSKYIAKSDSVLIGPGFMRFASEKIPHKRRNHICDQACQKTRKITIDLFQKFPEKKWVVDAGSLQVIEPELVPKKAIITPNKKEYKYLFSSKKISDVAKKYKLTIVLKGPKTTVCSPTQCTQVHGGNIGLAKGGTGDVQAGLTVALLAKNKPFLAASAASYIVKAAADEIRKNKGTNFNADDLAEEIPKVLKKHLR